MLLVKRGDLLQLSVFVDLKTVSAEIGHKIILLIHHRSVKYDFLDLFPENKLAGLSLNR